MGRLRILCLHGGGSNNEVTQFQTAGLRLSALADCHYLNAPHQAKRCYPGLDQFVDGPFYTWSEASDNEQWEKSLEGIAQYCRNEGPFDIAFGFSQGAAVITQFSYPIIWKERFGFQSCPWKSAILACAGAESNVTFGQHMKIDIPSLHIMGSVDPYVDESRAIMERWCSGRKRSYTHQKGHEIDLLILSREEGLATLLNEFLFLQNHF